jgi:hypothetical protein
MHVHRNEFILEAVTGGSWTARHTGIGDRPTHVGAPGEDVRVPPGRSRAHV